MQTPDEYRATGCSGVVSGTRKPARHAHRDAEPTPARAHPDAVGCAAVTPAHGQIDVALAEGNALMLAALSEIFDRDARFSLVSTTTSTEGFLRTSLTAPTPVAVVDWNLRSLGAETVIRTLREQGSTVRIIACCHADDNGVARRAMAAGAAGFFSHAEPPERLLASVIDVAAGRMVFPYLDVRELQDPASSLTRTEGALLDSLALGRTNKELAAHHGIAVNTVKFHLRNVYEKLDVRNRAQAIAMYYSSGNGSD